MKKALLFLTAIVWFFGCTEESTKKPYTGEGFKPVYISKDSAFNVQVSGPQKLYSPGKMYLYNTDIYIVDNGRGVHIIDNSNPSAPKRLNFVNIPGVKDVVVKNGVLYADNITDLVAIDISDLANISLKKRIKDIYPLEDQYYPDNYYGYFECVETSKGYVLRWKKQFLKMQDVSDKSISY